MLQTKYFKNCYRVPDQERGPIFISLGPNIKVAKYVFLFTCVLLESLFYLNQKFRQFCAYGRIAEVYPDSLMESMIDRV